MNNHVNLFFHSDYARFFIIFDRLPIKRLFGEISSNADQDIELIIEYTYASLFPSHCFFASMKLFHTLCIIELENNQILELVFAMIIPSQATLVIHLDMTHHHSINTNI